MKRVRRRWFPPAAPPHPAGSPGVASVFLSYSGTDTDRARTVIAVLERNNHVVWAFGDRMRAGVNWRTEMLDSVVRNDVVVFLASGRSVVSGPCREELACAREHGKKVVVVRVDPEATPKVLVADLDWLRELQWIVWDDPDAAEFLLSALATDFDQVRRLTRVDLRATDWDRRNRPGRLLLAPGELTDAEDLIADPGGPHTLAEARPTPLARRYVQASRVRRTRLHRIRVGLAVVVIAVLVGSLLYAQHRDEQRLTARRAEVVQQLRSQAQQVADTDPAGALRLQLAAYSLDTSPAGHAQLARAVVDTPLRRFLPEPGNKTGSLAYTRHGSLLISGGFDAILRAYPTDATLPIRTTTDAAVINTIATSPASDLVVTSGINEVLIQRAGTDPTGAATLQTLTTIPAVDQQLSFLDLSADGTMLVSGGLTPDAQLLSLTGEGNLRLLARLPATRGVVTATRFADTAALLAVADEGAVTVWDVGDGEHPRPVTVIPLDPPASALVAFSPDGQSLAVSDGGRATVYSLSSPGVSQPVFSTPAETSAADVTFVPPAAGRPATGALLATIQPDGAVALWDTAAPAGTAPVLLRQARTIPAALAASPDGTRLAVAGVDGSVTEWLVHPRGTPRQLATGPGTGEILDVAASRVRQLVAVVGADAPIADLIRVPDGVHLPAPPYTGRSSAVDLDDGTGALATGDLSGFVAFTDNGSTGVRSGVQPGQDPVSGIHLGAGATLIATADGEGPGHLWRVGPQTLTHLGELAAVVGPAERVSIAPDATRVAVGGRDGTVVLYDVAADTVAKSIELPPDLPGEQDRPITSLAWFPDGRHLAVGTELGIRIFDPAATTTPVGRLTGAPAGLALTAVPAAAVLAGWGNGAIDVWDTADPLHPVLVVTRPAGARDAAFASFTDDGRWLVLATLDTWQLLDLTDEIDTAADPLPHACLAATGTDLPDGLRAAIDELDPPDPCRT